MPATSKTSPTELLGRLDAVITEIGAIADGSQASIAPEVAAALRAHRDGLDETRKSLLITLWGEPVEGLDDPDRIGAEFTRISRAS